MQDFAYILGGGLVRLVIFGVKQLDKATARAYLNIWINISQKIQQINDFDRRDHLLSAFTNKLRAVLDSLTSSNTDLGATWPGMKKA
jgi:hypothetical protein